MQMRSMMALVFALAATIASAPASAAPPAGFNARVETLRKSVGVPGMAIAIVENEKSRWRKAMA